MFTRYQLPNIFFNLWSTLTSPSPHTSNYILLWTLRSSPRPLLFLSTSLTPTFTLKFNSICKIVEPVLTKNAGTGEARLKVPLRLVSSDRGKASIMLAKRVGISSHKFSVWDQFCRVFHDQGSSLTIFYSYLNNPSLFYQCEHEK